MGDGTVRVGTFNIRHGEGRDRKVDLRRTADVIRGLDVDLIALQELDVGLPRSNKADQPAELADLLGMHVYFLPTLDSDGGEYGIALAARDGFRAAAERLPRIGDEEPRGAIVAAWRKVGIVTTHLSRDPAARREQTAKLVDLVGKLGTPALVLGDMNQPPKDLSPLTDAGFAPVSAPKGRLGLRRNLQIDHILVSADVTVIKAWTVPTTVSDHSPLIAQVLVPGA